MFGTTVLGAFCAACWADSDGGLMSDILPANVGNGIFTFLYLVWIYLVIRKMWTLWLPMATIHLRGKGRFGRNIRFVKGREAKAVLAAFSRVEK
jgi:hypothetical protein